jgi:hypothetical protein
MIGVTIKYLVKLVLVVMLVLAASPAAYAWNKSTAVSYAETWALGRNSAWKDLGGKDCTNFTSQCLKSGGVSMDTIYVNPGYWYMTKNMYNQWIWGSPWTVANDFFEYFRTSSRTASKRYFVGSYDWKSSTSRPVPPNNNTNLNNGDFVSIDYTDDGRRDHSLIVVKQNTVDNYNSNYTGDVVDYHSDNFKHVIWHVKHRLEKSGNIGTASLWAWGLDSTLS